MDDATALAIMQTFGKAFFKRDRALLEQAIAPDFEWHGEAGPDAPHGRILRGVEGLLQGIADEERLYENVRLKDIVIRALGEDQILMSYLSVGQYRDGEAFSLRGIELLTVRDGRVAKKDVFSKQLKQS